MSAAPLVTALLAAVVVAAGIVAVRARARSGAALGRRIAIVRSDGRRQAGAGAAGVLTEAGGLAVRIEARVGAEAARLRQTLYAAGIADDRALERFLGLKLALAGGLVALALLLVLLGGVDPLIAALLGLGAAVAGLRGPDALIAARAGGRRAEMERGLPDMLDLLVVCAEAGVGLEAALERVATEIGPVHRALGRELEIAVSEMRLLPDRLQALANMGARARLDSIGAVAITLSQTLRYGTPLGRALRTLAADQRLARQTRMEARAARLPVLITIPMILFILPATALVVAGPAFLQLVRSLGQINR